MANKEKMEIRLTGDSLRPATLRLGELVKVLASVEDLLSALVMQEHPDIGKEELIIGLIGISDSQLATLTPHPTALGSHPRAVSFIRPAALPPLI